jgi:hypothetical protein
MQIDKYIKISKYIENKSWHSVDLKYIHPITLFYYDII